MKKLKFFGKNMQIEDTAACELYKELCVGKYTQYP